MDWKEKLKSLEESNQWNSVIALLEKIIQDYPDDPEPSVRMIYFLHDLLVEKYPRPEDFDHDALANTLLNHFKDSSNKFKENPEYLFFVGKIMHIAEWYFGQKDTSLALRFQKDAMELEPENDLYRWAYYLSTSNDKLCSLTKSILENEKWTDWLKSKGFPGEYLLMSVKHCIKKCEL